MRDHYKLKFSLFYKNLRISTLLLPFSYLRVKDERIAGKDML